MSAKKRTYYNHILSEKDLPNEDLLISFIERLRAGDASVVNPIIESRIRLALGIVGYYARSNRRRIDDIVSIALMALTEAVSRAATALVDNNLDPYLTTSIFRAINKFLSEDKLISIPKSSKYDNDLKDITVISYSGKHDVETEDGVEVELAKQDLISYTPNKEAEYILELLDTVCQTQQERDYVRLKVHGYNNKEVAEKLEIYESQVSKLRQNLEIRFMRGT